MNILPFVTVFLVVLSILAFSSLKDFKIFSLDSKALIGYFEAKRHLRNLSVETYYKKLPKKSLVKKEKKEPTENVSAPTNYRESKAYFEKINLTALLESPEDKLLKKAFANLFESLYGHAALLSSEKEVSGFVDNLVEAEKDSSEPIEFLKLYLDDGNFNKAFYKMLKGTKTFNLETKEGYPPLEDMFSLEIKDQKAFAFHSLPKSFLQALFGDSVARGILAEEAKLRLSNAPSKLMTKESLKELVHRLEPGNKTFDTFIEHFDFKKPSKQKQKLEHIEKDTKIKVSQENF